MTKHFDFTEFLKKFEAKGKALYGEKYQIENCDLLVLEKMLAYFDCNEEKAAELNVDFAKGVMLIGKIGVGKTSAMRVFREFLRSDAKYIIRPCREVAFEFLSNGTDTLFRYTEKWGDKNKHPKDYCFDDLGLESKSNYFGNNVNVMREIILSRYDLYVSRGLLTHFTSNLNASQITEMYGNEVRSRLREMCNIIPFDTTIEDNRK